MPTIEATVEFEVYCDKCGAGICNSVTVESEVHWRDGKRHKLTIEPCSKCLEAAELEGSESRDKEVEGLEKTIQELRDEIAALQTEES